MANTPTPNIKRQGGLKPHLVKVFGHAGDPYYGIVLTRSFIVNGARAKDVLCVRPIGPADPVKMCAYVRYLKPLCPTELREDKFISFLDKLVTTGPLTRRERQHFITRRKQLLHPTTLKRKGVEKIDPRVGYGDGPPAISSKPGTGAVTAEWRRLHGIYS